MYNLFKILKNKITTNRTNNSFKNFGLFKKDNSKLAHIRNIVINE